MSRTSSGNVVVCFQPEHAVRLRRIAEQEVHLGGTEIARIDLDDHLARLGVDADLLETLAAPRDRAADLP
jgi:hypothetical protein